MAKVSKEAGSKLFRIGERGEMAVPCKMTPAEVAKLEHEVTATSREYFRVEAEKKALVKPLNERLASLKKREEDLLDLVSAEVVERPVPVQRVADFFRGETWVVRLDGEEPEEVPETRRALTSEERQTVLPGVVLDGDSRPDAQVLPLFHRRLEEAPREDATEAAPAAPWVATLASPFEAWRLEESLEGASRRYMLTNDTVAYGPLEYEEGFHQPGQREGLPEDVRTAMARMWGEEPPADGPGSRTESFLLAAENLADGRWLQLRAASEADSIPFGAPEAQAPEASSEAPGMDLRPMSGHQGWALYLHQGHAYLRPPTVDRFEAPASSSDVGPFAWNGKEKMLEPLAGAPVSDDWMKTHSRLLEDADVLVREAKVTGVKELEVAPTSGAAPKATAPDGTQEESELHEETSQREGPEEEADGSGPAAGGGDADSVARKLSLQARMVVKTLGAVERLDSESIGSRARCKAGAVLKGLADKGVAARVGEDDGAPWALTSFGREVLAALESLGRGKGGAKKPTPSTHTAEDVPY